MDEKQITLRIENTAEQTKSPILLSGPVEIFATLDTIEDLNDPSLLSAIQDYYNEEFKKYNANNFESWLKEMPGLVVYVEKVKEEPNAEKYPNEFLGDSYTYRGAYFYTKHFEVSGGTLIKRIGWQEILLGTHSHDNIDVLSKFQPLDDIGEKQILVFDGKNIVGEKLSDIAGSGVSLPELPLEIQNKIKEYESYKVAHEYPDDSEEHHLDAPLNELEDTYDWFNHDKNTAVGTCRDIYYSLMKDKKRLYIDSNMHLDLVHESEQSLPWMRLSIDEINYSGKSEYEDVIVPQLINNYYIFKLSLPVELDETSEVFLFDNDKVICDSFLQIFSYDNEKKEITFKISKRAEFTKDNKDHVLKLLIVKDADKISGFRQIFLDALADENNSLSLSYIDKELTERYIRNELEKKPVIPKLYLSTDEYGNLTWDNTLLPAQTFYAKTKIISGITDKDKSIELTFEDVNFNSQLDFPLMIIDGFFVNVPWKFAGKDIKYELELAPENYNYTIENGTQITLVVIKNSSQGSITDELARNYISREEAVSILSRGKLRLDDYVKKTDLNKYSTIGHSHSQYALKGHNHDSRYANFYHTHPELLEAVAQLIAEASGGDSNEILKRLESLSEENQTRYIKYITGLFQSAGFRIKDIDENGNPSSFVLDDKSLLTDSEVVKNINKILYDRRDKDGNPYLDYLGIEPTDDPLTTTPSDVYLSDVLLRIVKLFEHDFIYDSQVKLEATIPVIYPVGGIKPGTVYNKDTDLRQILTDMFNPYISVEDCLERMTPSAVKLNWKIKINNEVSDDSLNEHDFKEIEPDEILEGTTPELYFEVVEPLKIYESEDPEKPPLIFKCEMNTLLYQKDLRLQKTTLIVNDEIAVPLENVPGLFKLSLPELSDDEKETYKSSFEKFIKGEQTLKCYNKTNMFAIDNKEEVGDVVFDSYGIKWKYIPNRESEEVAELEIANKLEWHPAHVYIGTVSDDDIKNIENIDVFEYLTPKFVDDTLTVNLDISEKKNILFLLRNDIENRDITISTTFNKFPDMDISQYFKQIEDIENEELRTDNGKRCVIYHVYYYRIYNSQFTNVPITISSR